MFVWVGGGLTLTILLLAPLTASKRAALVNEYKQPSPAQLAAAAALPLPIFQGAWKYTYASTNPATARDFCIKYLGALNFGRPKGRCGDIQWVYWPKAKLTGPMAPRFGREAGHFHLHFVKQTRRPAGPLSIASYERHRTALHRRLEPHDAFLHERVTLETQSFAPLRNRLLADGVPHLMLANPSGSVSLFVEVPHGNLIELVAPLPAPAPLQPWRRCGLPQPEPTAPSSALAANDHGAAGMAVSELVTRTQRFVLECTDPLASARFAAEYFFGTLSTAPCAAIGGGHCFQSATVTWNDPPFELVWVKSHAARSAGLLSLEDEESYRRAIHANLSAASVDNWDAYMDFHPGLLFDDCDRIILQLMRSRVPFFRARHSCDRSRLDPNTAKKGDACMSIFVVDGAGLMYELMCPNFSLLGIDDVTQFDQCLAPTPDFSARIGDLPLPISQRHNTSSNSLRTHSAQPAPDVVNRKLANSHGKEHPTHQQYGGASERSVSANQEENKYQPKGATATGLRWSSWHQLQDREYMRTSLFPAVGRLAGADGLVLDLGVQAYSADDRHLANVSQTQWFFCDPDPGTVPPESGTILKTTLARLPLVWPELRRRFRVLVDYGVLGALPKNGNWLRTDMEQHAAAYAEVLAPGGVGFLKWDFTLVRYHRHDDFLEDLDAWRHVRRFMAERLRFREEYVQLSPKCPPEAAALLTRLFAESPAEAARSNFSYTSKGTVNQKCGYSFSTWEARPEKQEATQMARVQDWHCFGCDAISRGAPRLSPSTQSTPSTQSSGASPCACAASPGRAHIASANRNPRVWTKLRVRGESQRHGAGWSLLATDDGWDAVLDGRTELRPVTLHVPAGFWPGSCADPFVLNRTLVCEMLRQTGGVAARDSQGVIGLGELRLVSSANGGARTYEATMQVAIEEPWHLSYPYSFREGGTLYIIPDANQFRQHLFRGAALTSGVRLGAVYECSHLPCTFVRELTPGSSQYADGNLLPLSHGLAYSAYPWARASPAERKCGRNAKTWLTTSTSVVHGAFEARCFAQSATRFATGGRGAGRLRQYVPVQYSPEAYGQYIDLYALHSWDYARTLALGNSSGYCGMHHVAEDPFSSLVVVDVKECAAN